LGREAHLIFQIVAAVHRLRAPPFGEVAVAIAQLGPHGGPIDRLFETFVELALRRLAAGLDDHLRGNIPPIDNSHLRHAITPPPRPWP
jgi:hypothetical protein